METSITKLTLIQKVAVIWLKNVDNSLFMFNTLKRLSAPMRYLFYVGLIGFSIFMMIFTGTLLTAFVGSDVAGLELLKLMGNIIFYGASIGMILVLTLESVYKLDVATILVQNKARQKEIKEKKLQYWRLRNMPIFVRIFLYICIFVFLYFVMYSSAEGAYSHLFNGADLTHPLVQQQKNLFINEFKKMEQWFTFLYVISTITLDYFVSKKRDQREVSNGVV